MLAYLRGKKPQVMMFVNMGKRLLAIIAIILLSVSFYKDSCVDDFSVPYRLPQKPDANPAQNNVKTSGRHDFVSEIVAQNSSSNIFDNSTAVKEKEQENLPKMSEFIIIGTMFAFVTSILTNTGFTGQNWDAKLKFTAIFSTILCLLTNIAGTVVCVLTVIRTKYPLIMGGCVLGGLLILFELLDLAYYFLRR